MSFTGIKQDVLERIMKQLEAIGAEYTIIANGTQYGTLELAEEPVLPKKNAKRFDHVRDAVRAQLQATKVGEVTQFAVPDELDLDAYRSHICNQARGLFGYASIGYNTSADYTARTIDLIRLA